MRQALRLGAMALVVWAGLSGSAALGSNEPVTVGPTDDWMPLREGAEKLKISDDMVARILDASLQLVCDQGSINAWFLAGKQDGVYTNAHVAFRDGEEHPLTNCRLLRSLDLANEAVTAPNYPIAFDSESLSLAGTKSLLVQLSGDEVKKTDGAFWARGHDRIWIPLQSEVPGRALPVSSEVETMNRGRELFFVSTGGPWAPPGASAFEPMIQKCIVQRRARQKVSDVPPLLVTNCDHRHGTSAGLLFVRDNEHPGELIAVAMHSGGFYPPENQDGTYPVLPYDERTNGSLEIGFDPSFFHFPIVPTTGPNGIYDGLD